MAENEQETEIYVQINAESGAVVPQGVTEDFVRATEDKMRQVSQLIKNGCKDLVSDISGMARPPAEIKIEFGVDVGTEGGVPFITKGSISANFKVSAIWKAA
jgi:hypothetical protein